MAVVTIFDPTTGANVLVNNALIRGALGTGVAGGNVTNTAITTVGAGALTAAAIAGGLITRSGPTAAYSDTTPTAALLLAALGGDTAFSIGSTGHVDVKNTTNFVETITAGSGITLSPTTLTLGPNTAGSFLLKRTAAAAFTLTLVTSAPLTAPVQGTVTANATTPVVVADATVTATSQVLLTYKSGAQGATGAFVSSKTAGVGFSIKSVASDTAVYDYMIIG